MGDEHYPQNLTQTSWELEGFFNDIKSLTKYLLFDSWEHLIEFMLDDPMPRAMGDTS